MRNRLLVTLLAAALLSTGGSPKVGELPSGEGVAADLEAIRARGVLRLITRNSPNTYFLYRGEQKGFEYELAKGLATRLGVGLEVVVVPDGRDPVAWLREGRGDLVGASLVADEVSRPGVVYSRPYKQVMRVVLVRNDSDLISKPKDLLGRKVCVAAAGREYWRLRALEVRLGGLIDIEQLPAETPPELIIADLSRGDLDATVAKTDVASLAMGFHGNLKIACALGPSLPVSWGFRSDCPGLAAAADEFLEEIEGTFFFNHLCRRYYDGKDEYRGFQESVFLAWQSGRLSRFDDQIRRHADAFGMDWLLIAALMYHESSFNPAATSVAGARGLLQLMPRTAVALGVADLYDPEENILAGIRYLNDQCEFFEDVSTAEDRLRFALASYNVGVGHVRDAQRLAVDMGSDPYTWSAVAEVLPLLSRREFFERAQHGYCRGEDAVRYVEEILRRWEIYSEYLKEHHAQRAVAAAEEPAEKGGGCLSAVSPNPPDQPPKG